MELKEFFINFSGLYSDLPTDIPGQCDIDLTSVDGTNCYCSEEASDAVRKALSDVPPRALHWIDTGDYHYASLFFLEKIRTPYTLFLFDHHPDDQDSAFGTDILSCGNWVARARQLPGQSADFLIDRFPPSACRSAGSPFCDVNNCLNAAFFPQPGTAGPQSYTAVSLQKIACQHEETADGTNAIELQDRTVFPQPGTAGPQSDTAVSLQKIACQQSGPAAHPEGGCPEEARPEEARPEEARPEGVHLEGALLEGGCIEGARPEETLLEEVRPKAYLSIDKDVMCRDFARTNWDQGDMTLQELKDLIIRISYKYDIIGADVCGGLTESKGAGAEDLKINCETDAELRELLLNLMDL